MAGLTANEMYYEAKVLYESIDSGTAPAFNQREWSVLFTIAQEQIILDLVGSTSRPSNGIDKDEFSRRKLANLVNYGVITTSGGNISSAVNTTNYANSFFVNLSGLNETVNGYSYKPLFYFEQRANTTLYTNIKVVEVTQDYVWANEDNPYKQPHKLGFWQLPYKDEKVIVIIDGGNLTHYYTSYIKKPYPIIVPWANYTSAMTLEGYNLSSGVNPDGGSVKTVGVNCRLHESLHREIVNKAVLIAKTSTKDQIAAQLQLMQENS